MIELDVELLTILSGVVIPLVVGLVTKKATSASFKLVVNMTASAVIGGITTAISTGGAVELRKWVVGMVVTWAMSLMSYYGLWKPSGVAGIVQDVAPEMGLGKAA